MQAPATRGGLEVSPGRLLQNALVQGQVGLDTAQTTISVELLNALHLVGLFSPPYS